MRRDLTISAGLSLGVHALIMWALTQVPWSLASPGLLAPPKVIAVSLVGPEPTAPPPAVSQPQHAPQPRPMPEPPAKSEPKQRTKTSPKAQQVREQPRAAAPQPETVTASQKDAVDPSNVSQILAMASEAISSEGGAGLRDAQDMTSRGSGGAAGAEPLGRVSSIPGGSGLSGPVQDAVPRYDLNPRPSYPEMARRRGYEGTVVLEVRVKKDGKVGGVRLAETSGYELLDQAALQAVPAWLFIPGMRNEQPVEMEVRVPVRFQLR